MNTFLLLLVTNVIPHSMREYFQIKKLAKVVPIHKDGSPKEINNYRPISLLSIFSKIMENIVAVRLNSFLELHSIIFPNQFGFRSGCSTTHALISITQAINKTIDNQIFGCGVFIDLKKAFDTVNHVILLLKLEHCGIRDVTYSLFKSYLSDRKQYTSLNGVDSDIKNISCDVPQGSVLDPLPFLLYINDLPNISSKLIFFLFANDTNIYFECEDLKKELMNFELKKLYEWLCINHLSLNISKTKFVIFHAPNKSRYPITILINNKAIDEIKHIKYLGVTLDAQLSFKYHIAELTKKISRRIGLLYKLRPFVTTKILTNVYYAIIYPFLPYGIPLWGSASKNLLTPILVLQKTFVRLATFMVFFPLITGPLEHTPPLFYKLNLLNIFDIYKFPLGKLVFDSLNNIGPIQGTLHFTGVSTRFSMRGNLHVNSVRTSRFGLGSLNIEGGHWATLPTNLKECSTKQALINILKLT